MFLCRAILVAVCCSSLSSARESKLVRKANALRVRQLIYLAHQLADPRRMCEATCDAGLKEMHFIWKQIAEKVDAGLGKRISENISQYAEAVRSTDQSRRDAARLKVVSTLVRTFEMSTAPSLNPSFQVGEQQFVTHCLMCHASDHQAALAPKRRPPAPALAELRLSPFRSFNALVVPKNHIFDDRMTDHELWSTAFYIQAWKPEKDRPKEQRKLELSLTQLSEWDDIQLAEYLRSSKHPETWVPWIRKVYAFDQKLKR